MYNIININSEVTPILEELMTLNIVDLGSNIMEHTTVKKLFKWLVDSNRSTHEFIYVIGALKWHVSKMHFKKTVFPCLLIDFIAVEALAMKETILDGPWEQAGWMLVKIEERLWNRYYYSPMGTVSNHASIWIFNIISKSSFCPNPYLQFEFIMLLGMVDLDVNKTQAFKSVLSSCSTIGCDYLRNLEASHTDDCRVMCLSTITMFSNQAGSLHVLDDFVATQLLCVRSSIISDIVHDVTYHTAVNPNIYTQPVILQGLTVLLQSVADRVQLDYKMLFKSDSYTLYGEFGTRFLYYDAETPIVSHIGNTSEILNEIICKFKRSCQTPQLVNITAHIILLAIETAIMVSKRSAYSIAKIDISMGEIFAENGKIKLSNSPLGLEIMSKKPFLNLRRVFKDHICNGSNRFEAQVEIPFIRALIHD